MIFSKNGIDDFNFLYIQGFFNKGKSNSIDGKIKKQSTDETLYEIFGQWSSQIYIKSKVCCNAIYGIFFKEKKTNLNQG